jgi:hypothetical protein
MNRQSLKSEIQNPKSEVRIRFFVFLFFLTSHLFAQTPQATPLEVVQTYVSPYGFPNKLKFFCCEMYQEWNADSTLGQLLPKRVQRDCQLIWSDSAYAAVSVWLHDSLTSRNIYFYLVKRQNWTIYAARSLVMVENAKDELKRLDSIPENQRGKSYTAKNGHAYAFDYANLKLWSGTDQELVNHFNQHKDAFVKLQTSLVKKGYWGKSDSLVLNALNDKKIKKQANALLLRDFRFEKKYPGAVFYMLGGMGDNTVGYVYQPDKSKVPPMAEKRFILVQPLGDGWYLFKTT